MNAHEIIADPSLTKTKKIGLLLGLGMTRQEVASALGVNRGFVHNVYAKIYGVKRQRVAREDVYAFTRSFGIEIEAHGIDQQRLASELTLAGIECHREIYNHTTRLHWKVVGDASVAGLLPFELVSPVLYGEAGLEEVKKVCEVLNRLGAKINKTCGLHVHFGVRELEHDTKFWRNLINNYATFESSLDQIMPTSRRGSFNTFCRTIVRPGLKERLNQCRDLRAIERATTGESRYHKVNIQSFWRHGTVEFRHHSGTTDSAKIANWVRLLNRLVEFSRHSQTAGGDFQALRQFLPEEIFNFYTDRRLQLAA